MPGLRASLQGMQLRHLRPFQKSPVPTFHFEVVPPMPFQAYLPTGFAHSHESRMFEQLAKLLAAGFGSSPDPVYLIGNAMFEDRELDAVLLKGDVAFVIDMKDYG